MLRPISLELGNIRAGLGKLTQVPLEPCRRMIARDGFICGEGRQMRGDVLQLLHAVAHVSQAIDLGFGGAKDQMIRLHLPDIQPQGQPQEV
jgi:hypothetical protein